MTARTYKQLMAALDMCINTAATAKLPETAFLLRVAQLDLAARVNGITEDELELVAAVLRHED